MDKDDDDSKLKNFITSSSYYFDKYVSENLSMYAAPAFLYTEYPLKLLKKWWLFMKTQYNEFEKFLNFQINLNNNSTFYWFK